MTPAQELREIKDEMFALLERAKRLLNHVDPLTRQRAESYWVAHLEATLEPINRYDHTMMHTIEELESEVAQES